MDTAARLLSMLTLLSARPWWTGADLAERLEVTTRTVRRDLTRLRDLGYPIEGTPGRVGGYRLGKGGRLPPLLLDDNEAIAVAVSLRGTAAVGATGLETAALSALIKLDNVMAPQLREQVNAVRAVTVDLRGFGLPAVDPDVLVNLAVACARPERLRFAYLDARGVESDRAVEPFRLVYTLRHWYLVAFDRDRDDWRSFRVDRLSDVKLTRITFTHRGTPDAAALVAAGIAGAGRDDRAIVRLHATLERTRALVDPTIATIVDHDEATTTLRIGGSATWIARNLAALDATFDIVEGDDVRAALGVLGKRLSACAGRPRVFARL